MTGTKVRYLVTGATGLVGGAFARRLAARGERYAALVRSDAAAADVASGGGEPRFGDLARPESLAGIAEGVEVVVHAAGRVDIWGPEREFAAVNVHGVAALLDEAKRAGVRRVVHISSAVVHGDDLPEVVTEALPYSDDPHPYVVTKIAGEKLVLAANAAGALETTVLRPVHVYGPRALSLKEILGRMRARRRVLVGGCRAGFPTVYAGHVADAIESAAVRDGAPGRAFLLTDGTRIPWDRFVAAIARVWEVDWDPRPIPRAAAVAGAIVCEAAWTLARAKRRPPITRFAIRMLDVDATYSIDEARRHLGYAPRLTLEQALAETRALER
jgi:nucleoside-diphosphate-sugar epimerase